MSAECLDCPPGPPAGEAETCPESRKACGHHCNHTWTHDECCYCRKTWGESGLPNVLPKILPTANPRIGYMGDQEDE